MLSILIFIGTALAVFLGICAVVYNYAPFIVDEIQKCYDFIVSLFDIIPPWLVPFLALSLALAILGIIIKLL